MTPCYNAAAEIGDNLRSLQRQTLGQWESIVVDDGSTDGGGNVVREFVSQDSRIRLITQSNGGPSVARNRALEQIRGSYVLFLDADDWIGPQMLEKCVARLEAEQHWGAVRVNQAITVGTQSQARAIHDNQKTGRLFFDLCPGNFLGPGSVVWRSSLLDQVGPFDPAIPGCEDWDFFLQLARLGIHFGHVDYLGYFYRKTRGSLSSGGARMWSSGVPVIERAYSSDPRVKSPDPEFAGGGPPEQRGTVRRGYAIVCAWLAVAEGDAVTAIDLCNDEFADAAELRDPQDTANRMRRVIWNAAALERDDWESLWISSGTAVLEYLCHLERQTDVKGYAGATLGCLFQNLSPAKPRRSRVRELAGRFLKRKAG